MGNRVWILQGNIKTMRPCYKLDYQYFRPYVISSKINDVAFHLPPPHPVLHVSLLDPYTPSSIPDHVISPPPPVEVFDGSEYEVAAILDSKIIHNKL